MELSQKGAPLKLFSLSSNRPLAEEISSHLGIELGKTSVSRFSDGEIMISIEESVRGCEVFVVQSTTDPVNETIMELLIMIDALKRASAKEINVVMPYYSYSRQDRKARPREPITAKLIANLIQKAGATRLISIDLHAPQIQGFFNIPVDTLQSIPIIGDYFKEKHLEDVVVIAPDHSSVTRARQLADSLKAPIAIVDRRGPRDQEHGTSISNIIGEVQGKTTIIIDDIIDTGRRVTGAARTLDEHGAKQIYACCTHPVLSGLSIDLLEKSAIKEVVVTNTIFIPEEKRLSKITQLSVASLLGQAISRIYENESVSTLFT
ncbi:ribose-phosphate diphosphokinase [Bacillaceae bacterium S4-13-58]